MSAPPIRHGAVLTDSAGRIAAVGPDAVVPQPEGVESVTFPDDVLLPGLVNAHTHLELQPFRDAVPERDFPAWIAHMRRIREETLAETYRDGARAGLIETWRHGTTTVADVGVSGATVAALAAAGGRGTYYHEVIGPDPKAADEIVTRIMREVERLRAEAPASVRIGISPHAPYSVSPQLARLAADRSRAARLPLATHLAESAAEVSFVTRGEGPFADAWRRRGIALPPPAPSPVGWAADHGLLRPDMLGVHLVHAASGDLGTLATHDVAVAVCIRSNRRHGHGDPPLAAMLAAGVRVGLGTDSAASVGDLDLLAEARAAQRLAGLTAEQALRLITIDGARALAMEHDIGSLEVGKWADWCVVRCRGAPRDARAVFARLLEPDGRSIVSTCVAGRWVHRP